jgi:hypothetical protein
MDYQILFRIAKDYYVRTGQRGALVCINTNPSALHQSQNYSYIPSHLCERHPNKEDVVAATSIAQLMLEYQPLTEFVLILGFSLQEVVHKAIFSGYILSTDKCRKQRITQVQETRVDILRSLRLDSDEIQQ